MKKLYKSQNNKVIAGVIGGVGEYFDIDPTLLRLAYVLIAILTHLFPAIIAYAIAVIIVPKHPHAHHEHTHTHHHEKPEEKN